MTNDVKNVPEIRFPEFDDEWKEKKFYECVEIEGKLVNPNFHEYQNLPHIGPGNIQKNTGRILNYNLVKDENLISGKFEFDEEDIIYGKINPQLQKICIPGFRGLASADTYPIKTISGVSNTYFIYYSLFTSRFFKYSVSVSMRTGMPKINKEELGSYNFYLPKIMEQQKIGEFFSKLDRQIELEEQKLAKLEEQKKGYMQKLFSQELRFKTKDNVYYSEWKLHKLGEIFKYSQGQQISVDKQFSVKSNEMKRFIRIVDITENPEPRFVLYESDTGLVNKEDLFMIRYGRPGIVSIGFEGIIANNLFKLIPKIKISTVYFYYLLSYNYYRINLLTNQSTMPALNFKSLDLLKFKIPSYKEQNKIGNFFTKFDELIEKQNIKIDGLKERKKGLLQKMFV